MQKTAAGYLTGVFPSDLMKVCYRILLPKTTKNAQVIPDIPLDFFLYAVI